MQDSLFKQYKNLIQKETEIRNEKGGISKYGYNPFPLQDAVGEKSAKKIWIEFIKLRLSGIETEELIHKIISKVRDMTAIGMGADQENLGIKNDYPYNKSKRDRKNWKEEDLKNLYTKLIEIYHHSRMGGDDMDTALEKVLLSI